MHIYPINGACHRVKADATAWGHRDASFATVIAGMPVRRQRQEHEVGEGLLRRPGAPLAGGRSSTLRPRTTQGRVRENFGPHYDRLVSIKRTYDPGATCSHMNQNIQPQHGGGRRATRRGVRVARPGLSLLSSDCSWRRKGGLNSTGWSIRATRRSSASARRGSSRPRSPSAPGHQLLQRRTTVESPSGRRMPGGEQHGAQTAIATVSAVTHSISRAGWPRREQQHRRHRRRPGEQRHGKRKDQRLAPFLDTVDAAARSEDHAPTIARITPPATLERALPTGASGARNASPGTHEDEQAANAIITSRSATQPAFGRHAAHDPG